MAYVTDDPRVRQILATIKNGNANQRAIAAKAIKALPPQKDAEFGYLDWEVAEALKEVKP